MNYFINGMSWRYLDKHPIELTDFTDYGACFAAVADSLKLKPNAFLALRFVIEADAPDEDSSFVIQYKYAAGRLSIVLIDEEEYLINEGIPLSVTDAAKIAGALDPMDSDERAEEIVKIIKDYGYYAVLGVQWAAFLLKESYAGTLDQYFDDLYKLEIH